MQNQTATKIAESGVISRFTPAEHAAWCAAREALREYVRRIHPEVRDKFAESIGTSRGQLSQIIHGARPCAVVYAVNIDRLTNGAVPMTGMAPNVDWDYVRTALRRRRSYRAETPT